MRVSPSDRTYTAPRKASAAAGRLPLGKREEGTGGREGVGRGYRGDGGLRGPLPPERLHL